MTNERGRISVGDFCRYDDTLCELIATDGMIAKLRREDGRTIAVKFAELFNDKSFHVVSSTLTRRPLPPDDFDALPDEVRSRALHWEHHISEVLDGLPVGSDPTARPRDEYNVAATALGQRERTKVAELRAAGTPVNLKHFQRLRRRYETAGLEGLIDRRCRRRASATGRVDDRYVTIVLEVLAENTLQSTRTQTALKWHVDRRAVQRFGADLPIPSHTTFHRLLGRLPQARHATGSARTRQSTSHQPDGVPGTVTATRPGEWMQIDTTPFDVSIRLDDTVTGRVELTILGDIATRTIAAAVLRPTTKAVDVALLLAKSMTPEPMRPGWVEAVRMSNSVLPYHVMRPLDERLEHAAARPIIIPENIVYDSGAVYRSATLRSACRSLGVSMQPAHKDQPTDKPVVERAFGSVKTLFAQYVTGFLGSSVEHRGKRADEKAVFSLAELQDLLDEWVVVCWQNRPHEGLRDPLNSKRLLTPNEKYSAILGYSGYVPTPLSGDDYIALLPSTYRVIGASGVKIDHRVYQSDELNPLRGELSGVPGKGKRWRVHYDPYDISRVWVRNHHGAGYLQAYWTQLHTMPEPFGAAIWDYARQLESERGQRGDSQENIKAAVDDLLQRASTDPPKPSRRRTAKQDRRIVARTRAAAQQPPTITAGPQEVWPEPLAAEAAPEDVADVVPLPVFDAEKEAQTW